MATTHPTASRNAMANAIAAIANANGTPKLVIGTSSLSLPSTGVLAVINLADFGAASSGVITSASNGNNATATAGGTAAIGIITDGDGVNGVEAFRGACGAGSGEVGLNSTTIAADDIVSLTDDVTWTAPS